MKIRENQSQFDGNKWDAYINAISDLKSNEEYSYRDLVGYHENANFDIIHNFPFFLAWHRQYIQMFEQKLQQIKSNVVLPYWDWRKDQDVPGPLKQQSLKQYGWTLNRTKERVPNLTSDVSDAMKSASFEEFSANINSPHGRIHGEIGGEMGSSSSPNDPLFWLHHCFIDKLWAEWQTDTANNAAMKQELEKELDTILKFPGTTVPVSVKSVLDIAEMGYTYQ